MRTLLPIRLLLLEIIENVSFPSMMTLNSSTLRATVYEDNTSALTLATDQHITLRTRHYHVRWHHFWESIRDGHAIVEYVTTDQQDADYLTKVNNLLIFAKNRFRVQGW